jgi:hypothetical protein
MGLEATTPLPLPWFLKLHWGWLLLAGFVQTLMGVGYPSVGSPYVDILFLWPLVQAGWLWKVDRRCTAIYWYGASLALLFAPSGWIPEGGHKFLPVSRFVNIPTVAGAVVMAGLFVWIGSLFVLRRDMQRHFSRAYGIALQMGLLKTFAFNTYYFQYKFNEIDRLTTRPASAVTPAEG